ncbi:MAG TPA: hypothetical protein VEC14_08740, partial [Reyranellaceae bacterium]|nr:hypothetical protein [Reyranellaceae bacterium]
YTSDTAAVGAWFDITPLVPPRAVIAEGTLQAGNGAVNKGASVSLRAKNTGHADPSALDTGYPFAGDEEQDSATRSVGMWRCDTDVSGKISAYLRSNNGSGDAALRLRTRGWCGRS